MSLQAMVWVFERSQHRASALLVLLAVANHTNKFGEHGIATLSTIAEDARCDRRQVMRIIPTLEATGELLVVRSGQGENHENEYTLPGVRKDGYAGPDRGKLPPSKDRKQGGKAVADSDISDPDRGKMGTRWGQDRDSRTPKRRLTLTRTLTDIINPGTVSRAEGSDINFQDWIALYPERRGKKGDLRLAHDAFHALPEGQRPRLLAATDNYAQSYRPMRGYAMDAHRFITNGEWLRYVDGIADPYEPQQSNARHLPVGSPYPRSPYEAGGTRTMSEQAGTDEVIVIDYEGLEQ